MKVNKPKFDARLMLEDAIKRHQISLIALVAETSLWASPQVHHDLLDKHGNAAFFPNRRRARIGKGEKRGQPSGQIIFDDNTYANNAIKQALGLARKDVVHFETCHIWPESCYDERYHTAIANLVLVPRALAALTDHDPETRAALQFRAFDLYGWHPAGTPTPIRPNNYPSSWLSPLPAVTSTKNKTNSRSTRFNITVAGVERRNLPKRKAILTVIRHFVGSGVTPGEIHSVLQWRNGQLFRSAPGKLSASHLTEQLREQYKKFDAKRFFLEDTEIFHTNDRTYTVSNQWGKDTEMAIELLLASFPHPDLTCFSSNV